MDILCNNINCDGIGMRRADWDNFRECQDIVLNGQVIWQGNVLSSAVKSQIYEDIVTTGHHSASLAAEVWRAANLYCKSHAATHPDLTAQGKLLSAFVNADKDMYCSLPLALTPEAQSALPTRWCGSDGNAKIDTGIIPTSVRTGMEGKVYLGVSGMSGLAGYNSGDSTSGAFTLRPNTQSSIGANFWFFGGTKGGGNTTMPCIKANQWDVFKMDETGVSINGTLYGWTHTPSFVAKNLSIYIFNTNPNGMVWQNISSKWQYCKIWTDGNIVRHFIPCHTTSDGMLDMQTLTFYANAGSGSFTIEKS